MDKRIEFPCTDCGKSYYVWPHNVKKRKTTLCAGCVLKKRNKTPKMRQAARKNGKRKKSAVTREKLRDAQLDHWTPERKEERSGAGNPSWNDGTTITSSGYVYRRCEGHPRAIAKGQYVLEHIIVMEKHIGRYLRAEEAIHHINEDRKDNRIENLVLCSNNSEHIMTYHGAKK